MTKKKVNKKPEKDQSGPILFIMMITIVVLFFFTIYWQKNLLNFLKPQESNWQAVKQTTIVPRD